MTRLTRRQTFQGLGGALAAALVSRHAAAAAAQQPSADVVRFAWWTDVGAPTPFQVSATGPGGAALLTLLYDTLTWKDETGIIPWLATEWTAGEDGLSYTFQLDRRAAWQDGTPLTAADVAFSFAAYARVPYRWMSTEVVESATATEDGAVRILLKRPYAAFLEEIAGIVPIIPRHVWEPVADPLAYDGADRALGSGPFTLEEHDEAAGAYRLVAHDGYWRGRPLVREWRQFVVPAEARVTVVQQGEADVSLSSDASVRDLLAGDERLAVHETVPLSIVRLAVNTERPPLDRKEVRQAIAYALDRVLIAETITRGPAIVGGSGVVPPETPWHNPAVEPYAFDPERARALLAGQTVEVEMIADPAVREPDLMIPMLEAVGITLNVQRIETAARLELLAEGNFGLALASHIGVGGDPDYLRRWYAGEETNAFAQGSIFSNEEYTRLGDEQATALDPARRREIVFRMQEILAEELPTIVLYHRRFSWVYDPAVFTPVETWGGLLNGVPFPNNKVALIAT